MSTARQRNSGKLINYIGFVTLLRGVLRDGDVK